MLVMQSFRNCLGWDSAFRMGRSFHQQRAVNENVLENGFVHLCDGNTRHHSLTNLKRACRFVRVSGGRRTSWSWCDPQAVASIGWYREVWNGPFWACWRPVMLLHYESHVEVWLCMMEVQPEEHCNSPAKKWQGPGHEVVQHAPLGRAWSFWYCAVQTCMIELSL